jgi:hypothetical protein
MTRVGSQRHRGEKYYNIQKPRNYPEEYIQISEAGKLPRRKHTKFRSREITQKKAYKIQKPGNYPEAYKIQKPGNYPEESTQHSEAGESLKSRKTFFFFFFIYSYIFFFLVHFWFF